MNYNDLISQTIVRLFDEERFYAEILLTMKRVQGKSVPIAGVCIKEQIELHINPETFCKFPLKQRVAILKHECEHILRDHIPRSKELAPEVYAKDQDVATSMVNQAKHKMMNIAADCAVNSNVKDLPDFCVFAEKFELERGQTLEWYLSELKDNEQMKEMMQQEQELFDNHDIWKDSEGSKDILKEKIKQAVNKAAENTRAAGRMTSENELAVQNLNQNSVNWKDVVRRFVAQTIETTIESSRKKRNRRYGIAIPGSVKVEDLHIGVAVDTSGSMIHALEQAMAEMGEIAKYAKVTVIEVDTEIKSSYLYDKRKKYKQLRGGGGTAYQPAFDFFNKQRDKIDALIYIGDMDNYDTEALQKPKYPVLWAIVGNQNPPADWGARVKVEIKDGSR
jgi:predicted metal-dependent peptidase